MSGNGVAAGEVDPAIEQVGVIVYYCVHVYFDSVSPIYYSGKLKN
jgi:hypothetical protein